jgi:hypothetical protein
MLLLVDLQILHLVKDIFLKHGSIEKDTILIKITFQISHFSTFSIKSFGNRSIGGICENNAFSVKT